MVIMLKDYYPFTLSLPLPSHGIGTEEGERVDAEKLTSTIFSMCFLMIVGSALGFTDTAHSSIMVGLGSGAGAGLEFCYTAHEKPKTAISISPQGSRSCYKGEEAAVQRSSQDDYSGSKCHEKRKTKISNMELYEHLYCRHRDSHIIQFFENERVSKTLCRTSLDNKTL